MSDYLQHLVARVWTPGGAIRPRQVSLFEPVVADEPVAESRETAAEADAVEIVREASPQIDPSGDDHVAAGREVREAAGAPRHGSAPRGQTAAPSRESVPRHRRTPLDAPDAGEVNESRDPRIAVLRPRQAPRPQPWRLDLPGVPPIDRPVTSEVPAVLAPGSDPTPARVGRAESQAPYRAAAAVRELEPSAAPPAGPTEVAPLRLPMIPAPLRDRAAQPDGGRPAVQVTIGRVEVRSRAGAAPARPQPASAPAAPKLEDYLQQRRGGSR